MERIILNGWNGCVENAPTRKIDAHVNYVAKFLPPGTTRSIEDNHSNEDITKVK